MVERHLSDQHVDGVLLLSLHDDDPLPTLLGKRGLPTVLGGRPAHMLEIVGDKMSPTSTTTTTAAPAPPSNTSSASVRPLHRGDRRPAGHGGGHRPPPWLPGGAAPASLPHDHSTSRYGDFSEASGADAMRPLIHLNPGLDAVFAASDLMAAGAIRALRELGRRVPADVAVVGFEDSAVARQTQPPLTTVHQSVEGMGREMARLLLARIACGPPISTVLDTHLVVRESA